MTRIKLKIFLTCLCSAALILCALLVVVNIAIPQDLEKQAKKAIKYEYGEYDPFGNAKGVNFLSSGVPLFSSTDKFESGCGCPVSRAAAPFYFCEFDLSCRKSAICLNLGFSPRQYNLRARGLPHTRAPSQCFRHIRRESRRPCTARRPAVLPLSSVFRRQRREGCGALSAARCLKAQIPRSPSFLSPCLRSLSSRYP